MRGDIARFQMPPIEGDIDEPVAEYLGSLGNAIAKALQALEDKMNDPNLIIMPGGRTLASQGGDDAWQSGDYRCTSASLASVYRRKGWVFCDGRNGTPNTVGAFVLGAAAATDATAVVTGGTTTGEPDPSDTLEPNANNRKSTFPCQDGCGAISVADDEHVHDMASHVHSVVAAVRAFRVIWMMKL